MTITTNVAYAMLPAEAIEILGLSNSAINPALYLTFSGQIRTYYTAKMVTNAKVEKRIMNFFNFHAFTDAQDRSFDNWQAKEHRRSPVNSPLFTFQSFIIHRDIYFLSALQKLAPRNYAEETEKLVSKSVLNA